MDIPNANYKYSGGNKFELQSLVVFSNRINEKKDSKNNRQKQSKKSD
jgi:hypothetical protein